MNPVRLSGPGKRLFYSASRSRPSAPKPLYKRLTRKQPEMAVSTYMNEPSVRNGARESEAAPRSGQLYSTSAAASTNDEAASHGTPPQQIQTIRTVKSIREARAHAASIGHHVGLVPTMGGLHEGHLDLIREAAKECDEVYVSIYLNPTQFAKTEDGWLGTYPQNFAEDLALVEGLNAELKSDAKYRGYTTIAFSPEHPEMYPTGLENCSRIELPADMVHVLEGVERPLSMTGAATVVMKFLNVVMPDKVYFGQKDFQQVVVLRRMIEEFHIPVQPRIVATRRDDDGLALSSRNKYFGERRRGVANVLSQVFLGAQRRFEDGKASRKDVLDAAYAHAKELEKSHRHINPGKKAAFSFTYISLADPQTLQEVETIGENGAVMSGALLVPPLEDPQPGERLGVSDDKNQVRLIDNVTLGNAGRYLGLTNLTDT